MGLDVYLYKYENYKETREKVEAFDQQTEGLYDKHQMYGDDWKSLTQEIQEQRRKAFKNEKREIAASLNLDLDSCDDPIDGECIEDNFPGAEDHYFKIGYFRSSYNGSGINNVLGNLIGIGLKEIFEPGDEYRFQPNWLKAKEKCHEAIEKLSKILSDGENFRCVRHSWNEFQGPPKESHPIKSEEDALQAFLEERRKYKEKPNGYGSYSNGKGEFYFDEPIAVAGIIQGVNKRFFVEEYLPAHYIIYKDSSMDWYLTALKIVDATIDRVLMSDDPTKYYLKWSS